MRNIFEGLKPKNVEISEDKKKEYLKYWKGKNPEKVKKHKQKWITQNKLYPLWSKARRKAQNGALRFELTLENLVMPSVCPVLKKPFTSARGESPAFFPTLMVVDADKGWVDGNVIIVSCRAKDLLVDAEDLKNALEWVSGH